MGIAVDFFLFRLLPGFSFFSLFHGFLGQKILLIHGIGAEKCCLFFIKTAFQEKSAVDHVLQIFQYIFPFASHCRSQIIYGTVIFTGELLYILSVSFCPTALYKTGQTHTKGCQSHHAKNRSTCHSGSEQARHHGNRCTAQHHKAAESCQGKTYTFHHQA